MGGKMKSDTVIRMEGMKALCEHLGLVDAERFISLIHKENFDYTEWQRDLWKEKTLDDIFNVAKSYNESKQ